MVNEDEIRLLRELEAWEAGESVSAPSTAELTDRLRWARKRADATTSLLEKRGFVKTWHVLSTDPPERSRYIEITREGLERIDQLSANTKAAIGSLGFAIMQIGHPQLDGVWDNVFVPALRTTGLEPRRVDRHNEGGLLKSEILTFIREARIILADLTNERPNVYLEVGYALGIEKQRNLILTAREDHKPDRPGRQSGDPKVHFDLAGYEIIYWSPDDLEGFRRRLEITIRRRLALPEPIRAVGPATSAQPLGPIVPDGAWIEAQRTAAATLFAKKLTRVFVEFVFKPEPARAVSNNKELILAAKAAISKADGWPIGLFESGQELDTTPDGISHTIEFDPPSDHWALRRDGTFYCAENLYEFNPARKLIKIDYRVRRVAEAFLYAERLYDELGYSAQDRILLTVNHLGLRGTQPALHDFGMRGAKPTTTDEAGWSKTIPLATLRESVVRLAGEVVDDLLVAYGLGIYGLETKDYEEILEQPVAREREVNRRRVDRAER